MSRNDTQIDQAELTVNTKLGTKYGYQVRGQALTGPEPTVYLTNLNPAPLFLSTGLPIGSLTEKRPVNAISFEVNDEPTLAEMKKGLEKEHYAKALDKTLTVNTTGGEISVGSDLDGPYVRSLVDRP